MPTKTNPIISGPDTRQKHNPDLVAAPTPRGVECRYHDGNVRERMYFVQCVPETKYTPAEYIYHKDDPKNPVPAWNRTARFERHDYSVPSFESLFPYSVPYHMSEAATTFQDEKEKFDWICGRMKAYGFRAFRKPSANGALPFVQRNGDYWRTKFRYPEWSGDQMVCVEATVGSFSNKFVAYRHALDRIMTALDHAGKYTYFAKVKGFDIVTVLDGSARLYAESRDRSTCRAMTAQEIIDLEHDYYDDCITVPRLPPAEQAVIDEHARWNLELRRDSLKRAEDAARKAELIKIADRALDQQVRAELAAKEAEAKRLANRTEVEELGDFIDSLGD